MGKNNQYIMKKIQNMIKGKNFCVIFDTNIYLNLYEYSPEVTEFFVELSELIQDNIMIPSTVKREFEANHSKCLNHQKRKFKNVSCILNKPLDQMKDKINKQFDILKGYKIPEIKELQDEVQKKINQLEEIFKEYSTEHNVLEKFNNKFLNEDKIKKFIDNRILSKGLLKDFSVDKIYSLCVEGEKRYNKEIPPGYKDGLRKKGVQAYGDFFIWEEVMQYCKEEKYNLIFVTDDVKEDWFEIKNSERIGFRQELVEEFNKKTSMKVIGTTSNEFFSALSYIYNKDIPTTVEWILGYDVENYIEKIIKWGLFENILQKLTDTGDMYVNIATVTDYDGSKFEISDEISDNELKSYEFQGYCDGEAEYLLRFKIKVKAYSQNYWTTDCDTKDMILSEPRVHILEGEITVSVKRTIESYLDDLVNDTSYSDIEIVGGNLCEISSYSKEELCVECGKSIGQYINYDGEPICCKCMIANENGDICTSCGRKIPHEYMTGDFKCIDCFREED